MTGIDTLSGTLATAVRRALANGLGPDPAVTPDAAERIAAAVAADVVPVAAHLANAEPWYRSRVTWGAILSTAIPVLGAFGIAIDAVDADTAASVAVALGSAAGGLLTLYGRWAARRPIGGAS